MPLVRYSSNTADVLHTFIRMNNVSVRFTNTCLCNLKRNKRYTLKFILFYFFYSYLILLVTFSSKIHQKIIAGNVSKTVLQIFLSKPQTARKRRQILGLLQYMQKIRKKFLICSHLLEKSFIENFNFISNDQF